MNIETGMAAVVTGGASGLGEATARRLAASGAKVAVFDKNAEAGEAVAKDIGGAFFDVDVTDVASVEAGLAAARGAHGQERVTVNCAGVGWAARTVDREGKAHDAGMFRTTIMINLVGSFHVASMSAAGMAAADALNDDGERGLIVNTASVAAYDGQIGQIAYAASKGGIVGMTLPMARDMASKGVRVMTIAPGLFLTPMLKGLPQEAQDSLGKQVPFPSRLGDPKEYAELVAAIAANPMLNGETIRLDGSIRMAPK
ncbi:MAG: SDR family NAD(P)-dependent oxidoreductase [Pseudomonadota bacterium]